MAKAKSQIVGTLNFQVKDSVVFVDGILVSQDENQIVMDVKRPRSSKYDRMVFATANLLQVFISGDSVSIAQRGTFTDSYPNVTVQSVENGFIVVADEDGNQTVCAPGTWEFVADVEEEAPKATKKAPAAKGKKAAKVEEEEEEEEEFEDEEVDEDLEEEAEEEEKPAKAKKAAAKKAPAAKGKKAKQAEPEDEDADDDDWE